PAWRRDSRDSRRKPGPVVAAIAISRTVAAVAVGRIVVAAVAIAVAAVAVGRIVVAAVAIAVAAVAVGRIAVTGIQPVAVDLSISTVDGYCHFLLRPLKREGRRSQQHGTTDNPKLTELCHDRSPCDERLA